jgi:hypothetical protein
MERTETGILSFLSLPVSFSRAVAQLLIDIGEIFVDTCDRHMRGIKWSFGKIYQGAFWEHISDSLAANSIQFGTHNGIASNGIVCIPQPFHE